MADNARPAIDQRAAPLAPSANRRWLLAVLGTAFCVGLVSAWLFERLNVIGEANDPYGYGEMGERLANGESFSDLGVLLHRRGPLYPLTLAGLYSVFGVSAAIVRVAHCLMFASVAALAFDLGRRMFNLRTGLLAAGACTFNPMLIRYIPTLHVEIQLTLLFTLMVWCLVRFVEQPTWKSATWAGVATGATTLTKAVALLLPAVFIMVWRWYQHRAGEPLIPRDRRITWAVIVLFAAQLATILPWTIRNYRATDHFVLVSTGTSDAFLRSFIFTETDYILLRRPPYTDAENASNDYFRRLAEQAGTVWQRDEIETDKLLNEEAVRRFQTEPLAVARKSVIGVATFWYQMTSIGNSLVALVHTVVAWSFASVGIRRARRKNWRTWPLLVPVLYLNLILAVLLALGRYSVPVLPALLVVSALGADTLLGRRWPTSVVASTEPVSS
jgi:4-amino-4-deoxy-L-arabinose transferase-like glycosyltransferase